ncbi:MAG: NAD(P)H-hydrate dehydratase [Sphingomonadales bacterium]|nr:NAD(P)H-hydrate dehydratase [Sphingomonadales bacterium]
MPRPSDPVLTAAQMRDAEGALIAAGTGVDELMRRAGYGAADYVWRLAGGRAVTVLCGPGNNGGDGYVIAEAIRERGGEVAVIAAADPATVAAKNARAAYRGQVVESGGQRSGVLVDCLFGTGLTRPLGAEHLALLRDLAATHASRVAVDLPSGIEADLGLVLNQGLPDYHLTIALGAWKLAHFLMPAGATMGALRLVRIGVEPAGGSARVVSRPRFAAPSAMAHKYTRGLLGIVSGAMPGAALLAARAAHGAGTGYVKLLSPDTASAPAELVVDTAPLADVLSDARFSALLVGPGLGRRGGARERLVLALAEPIPAVLDADALVLLAPRHLTERAAPLIATPHEGELLALERAFDLDGAGSKVERAVALAAASRMVVVAKGADTVIAAPDGRIACAPRASAWLSTAGTGDVLAGTIASRLACGSEPFDAACEGVWLHGEAARRCPVPFTAAQLAEAIARAYAVCL